MTRVPQAPSILWFKSSSDPIEKTEEGERTSERERETARFAERPAPPSDGAVGLQRGRGDSRLTHHNRGAREKGRVAVPL